ncbi:YiiX/YebB-like N1pC/P60 family cysteine hydrolase [Corallococcus sp. Z5C101001]|uniref:YiiX/YebB-like N1pC/P60 family cysteine hydrolase n=1 Tax=Corallococcus sp. Z5C101001 TaxID=2596829 RepID=UPI00118078C5|nr:YiiX/YebB-like N1pC/P60 family cysteine hydrolase [Corallococcus sp. Z5C101001]TSC29530.1 peptidase [Corallococcus sp. Z5C101001]
MRWSWKGVWAGALAMAVVVWLGAHGAQAAPRGAQDVATMLRTGDVVFQTSGSRQSKAIQEATHSPLSHVGLVEVTQEGTFVVEAVQPVKRTPFRQWKERGVKGRLLVLRPEGLDDAAKARAVAEAKRHLGKPYDALFGWGDEAMYCSELVRKAYAAGAGVAYGTMERLGDLDVTGLKREIAERYRGPVPVDLELVTPASLAADARLAVVYSDFPEAR